MIEPISIGIIILGGVLFVVLWPQIVHLFSTTIIPWVREVISEGVADSLATIICFADNRMVGTRSQIKSAYKTFKETLLGCKSTYEKTDANAVTRKTFTIIRDPSGKLIGQNLEETIQWDELPEAVRAEMVRQNQDKSMINIKAELEKQISKTAEQKGILELLEES